MACPATAGGREHPPPSGQDHVRLRGVWHPYKHALTILHRAYFPTLARLECVEEARDGAPVTLNRKVLFLERLYASMLLASADVKSALQQKLIDLRTARRLESRETMTPTSISLELLSALSDLLFFWVPAMFSLGVKVQECA